MEENGRSSGSHPLVSKSAVLSFPVSQWAFPTRCRICAVRLVTNVFHVWGGFSNYARIISESDHITSLVVHSNVHLIRRLRWVWTPDTSLANRNVPHSSRSGKLVVLKGATLLFAPGCGWWYSMSFLRRHRNHGVLQCFSLLFFF